MTDLLIYISKFAFLIIISLFLIFGGVYILKERGHGGPTCGTSSKIQQACIYLMHIFAFFIIYLNDEASLLTALAGLVFIFLTFFIMKKVYDGYDRLILNGVVFLLDLGFIILYRLNSYYSQRQLIIAAAAFIGVAIIKPVLNRLNEPEKLKWVYCGVSLGLLLILFLMGSQEYGSTNWINFGVISFQPSEIVKLTFVMFLAASFRKELGLKKLIIPCVFGGAVVLMLVLQKDLGGALIFFMTFIILFYIGTGRKILLSIAFLLFSGACTGAFYLFPHVASRVTSWLNPWAQVDTGGYQLTQSLFAITTWGPFGSGLYKGFSSNIPFVEKDFIFAAVCEEFGGIFGLLIICVFIMIFYRGVNIALRCMDKKESRFLTLVSLGITGVLAFQTFVILGGVTGLLPITGVTLPFVGYGGTSVFMSIIMIGLLQYIYCREATPDYNATVQISLREAFLEAIGDGYDGYY